MTCAADERNLTLSARKEDKYLICVSREAILFFFYYCYESNKATKFPFDVKSPL